MSELARMRLAELGLAVIVIVIALAACGVLPDMDDTAQRTPIQVQP